MRNILEIDLIETPFSPQEAMVVLDLEEYEYEIAERLGVLQRSVMPVRRRSKTFAQHSFFDLLDFALAPSLLNWLDEVPFDHFEDLISIVVEFKCQSDQSDLFNQIERVAATCPDTIADEHINERDAEIIREIINVWSTLASKIVTVIEADEDINIVGLEDRMRYLKAVGGSLPFLNSNSLMSFLYKISEQSLNLSKKTQR